MSEQIEQEGTGHTAAPAFSGQRAGEASLPAARCTDASTLSLDDRLANSPMAY